MDGVLELDHDMKRGCRKVVGWSWRLGGITVTALRIPGIRPAGLGGNKDRELSVSGLDEE
jgi:hypothetical protein